MKILALLLLFTAFSNTVSAQTDANWIRYQSISPDGNHIVFTYKGDLYRVAASGGEARQLTFHDAHDFMPVWSKDGSTIAFASDRYGNFNIFTMSATGGPAQRLTFHSNDEFPYSFSHDNEHVIFGTVRMDIAEHRQFPTNVQPELYKISVNGGRVHQIFTIPAEFAQLSKDGKQMVYHDKKGYEDEWRKYHTSSVTRDIWLFDAETNQHTIVSSFVGENRQPIFTEDEQSIYYLSEEGGSFNVHKMSLSDPSQRTQLTHFDTHPVRFLSYGNGVLSFGHDGLLYTMKEGEEPKQVEVSIITQEKSNPDKFISVNSGVTDMAVSPDGKEIAFIARGEVFVTTVDGSLTKRITNTVEEERFVTFTPDGKGVVYARIDDGKWSIFNTERVRENEPFFFASSLLKESVLVRDDVDNYQPSFSPDGKKLAYVSDRRIIRVKDLASGRTVDLIGKEDIIHMREGDQSFEWSPDSKWLLVNWRRRLSVGEVLLVAADGSKRVNLTESGYSDGGAKWVNDGKQMIWFSNRDGLRSYATSGGTQRDVYSMFFSQEAWDDFNLSEEDHKLKKALEAAAKKDEKKDDKKDDDKKDEAVKDIVVDWQGLSDRRAKLTIHSSRLGDAVLSKDGETLYYLAAFENNFNLWETNLRTRETKMTGRLNVGFGRLFWDKDQSNLYLLNSGRISKVNLTNGTTTPVAISGEMTYDAHLEREFLFDHVYIRTKNIFYEPTFHGKDWDFLYTEYKKYLPHIGNSYEFAEMLSEMLGELNVSHAGARYSNSIENADATASLGIFIDYAHRGDGIKITEVIQGGPLDKANMGIKPGMIIEKIDGVAISANRDDAFYLNRLAGKFVLLDVVGPGRNERKQVVVKPITLGEERALLYRRFVRINEQEVDEKSGGRLGYVHIPGMSDGSYRNVLQDMLGKYHDREAVIVDGRFNGGGDLVSDLVMFFTGVSFNTYATADKDVDGEPTSRWTKPTITILNEGMYSDGHCYAAAYTELELGKSVGMPVPGTCSFAGWEMLADGTRWGVVPISARNYYGEWMENNQTEPTIRVKNMPGFIDKGVDQQLERTIQEMLQDLDAEE